jgi:acetyltransferase-like isoleucine patch superfamily enzyme
MRALDRPPGSLPHDWFTKPLPENVELGEGSWLHSTYAFLHCQSPRPHAVQVGRCSGIYKGSHFELGPDAEVTIGNYCTLVGAIICTNNAIKIGDYSFVAHEVLFADTAFAMPEYPDRPVEEGVRRETTIELGSDVWVGMGAILLQGAQIGRGAVVGARAVVNFKVPDYAVVAGNPAKIVGYVTPRTPQD